MPLPVLYHRLQTSGDGYSLRYELSYPAVLGPDGAPRVRSAERAALTATARQGKSAAIKAYSPQPIRKGWHAKTEVGAFLQVTISNAALLAKFVEDPTKAHDIRPRLKKALFWPGAAHPVRGVHHPGTPGKHRLPGLLAQLGRTFEAAYTRRVTPLLDQQVVLFTGADFEAFDA